MSSHDPVVGTFVHLGLRDLLPLKSVDLTLRKNLAGPIAA